MAEPTPSHEDRSMAWSILTVLLLVFALVAVVALMVEADPLCWRGYIAYDGMCAWE